MKFSIPYIDQDLSFWNNLEHHFQEHIDEIYFPIGAHVCSSGRPRQPQSHLYTFLLRSRLPKTVLINPIILSKPIEEIQEGIFTELRRLHQNYGLTKVTVSDLRLARFIKTNLKQYIVCASILMGISETEQINYIKDAVDSIVPDTSVVRNMRKLRALRSSFSGPIKLIVNEGCLAGCPWRIQHFYEMGVNLPLPASLCQDHLNQNPWLRLKSAWILPQHLHLYDGLFDVIKIAGRVTLQNPEKYMRVFNAYLNRSPLAANEIGSGPAGVMTNIPITEEFFHQTITCAKNCTECTICQDYYEAHK